MIREQELNNFKNYLQEEEMSENTIESYIETVKQYFNFAEEISKKNILDWKQELMSRVGPKTVNLRICGICKYCDFQGIPMNIKRVRIQKATYVENVITIEEYDKLIDYLISNGNERMAIIFKILGKTGVRVSELLKLKKSDLDRGYAQMLTKGKIRKILFPKSLIEEIKDYYKDFEADEYLALNRCGKHMTARGVAAQFKNYAKKCEIPLEKAHPHSLRHMFAIEFLKRNKDIALLADIMGHSGINTTMIYLRLSQKQQKDVIDKAVNW